MKSGRSPAIADFSARAAGERRKSKPPGKRFAKRGRLRWASPKMSLETVSGEGVPDKLQTAREGNAQKGSRRPGRRRKRRLGRRFLI